MENVDLNALVDKLADKIGLGVEKVQPIAEETIRQYQAEQFFYSMCGFGFLIVTICVGILLIVVGKKTKGNCSGYYAGAGCILFFGVLIGGLISMFSYGAYLAPLPNILRP